MMLLKKQCAKSVTIILCTLLCLAGCSASSNTEIVEVSRSRGTPPSEDPFEKINRKTYAFNQEVDRFILKPTAQSYKALTPWQLRAGVTNFFSNMGEVPTMINDVLQGQITHAGADLGRFAINTTIGIGGLFDMATHFGVERRYNDFGITLAKWGVKTAPYIMVPFFGPTTLRDGLALWANYEYMTLWPYIRPVSVRNSLFALDVINLRSQLLESDGVIKQASLDSYVFLRNAYLQKRNGLINSDGEQLTNGESLTADPLDDEDLSIDELEEELAEIEGIQIPIGTIPYLTSSQILPA